jgi:coenzyme F420 hydrogenase subunit beta
LDDIESVVIDGLCTGCGTCAGVCPTEAISMRILDGLFLPEVEEEKCTSCGLCLRCCAGHSLDVKELSLRALGKQPEDKSLGNHMKCYVGHSNDDNIRRNSSSGGMITQLLVFALEKDMIDGALVIRKRKDSPLKTEPFIARTREEIISVSRSKYCPAATNEALGQVLREKGRFAVVGLPCHIHGIRKAEQNVKELKERVVLRIGLMCSHTVNFLGTEFLLRKLGIAREQIAQIEYRGQGWPGSMLVELKTRSRLSIPYVGKWNAYWPIFSSFLFTPKRCAMCPDETNELADISVGDAWLPELKHGLGGESIIVTRTKYGEEILNQAYRAGTISLRSICSERVKSSQADPLKFKKDDLDTRLSIIESAGSKIPDFGRERDSSHSFISYVRSLFVLFNMKISVKASASDTLESLLISIPFPIFRLYYGVYRILLAF